MRQYFSALYALHKAHVMRFCLQRWYIYFSNFKFYYTTIGSPYKLLRATIHVIHDKKQQTLEIKPQTAQTYRYGEAWNICIRSWSLHTKAHSDIPTVSSRFSRWNRNRSLYYLAVQNVAILRPIRQWFQWNKVNHKKRSSLFLSVALANPGRFL